MHFAVEVVTLATGIWVQRPTRSMGLLNIFYISSPRFFIKPNTNKILKKVTLHSGKDDIDVSSERERVLSDKCNDLLKIQNLTKVYTQRGSRKPLVAVDR